MSSQQTFIYSSRHQTPSHYCASKPYRVNTIKHGVYLRWYAFSLKSTCLEVASSVGVSWYVGWFGSPRSYTTGSSSRTVSHWPYPVGADRFTAVPAADTYKQSNEEWTIWFVEYIPVMIWSDLSIIVNRKLLRIILSSLPQIFSLQNLNFKSNSNFLQRCYFMTPGEIILWCNI